MSWKGNPGSVTASADQADAANTILGTEGGPPMAVNDLERSAAALFTWDSRVVVTPEPLAGPVADLARSETTG